MWPPPLLRLLLLLLLVVHASASAHSSSSSSATHRHGWPVLQSGSKECALRQMTLQFAQSVLPERAPLNSVFDAINLQQDCGAKRPADDGNVTALSARAQALFNPYVSLSTHADKVQPPDNALVLYVDYNKGLDSQDGSFSSPLKTIAAAVNRARTTRSSATQPVWLVLRAGTHYVSSPVLLSAADSLLTVANYKDEQVVVSGAAPLNGLSWKAVGSGVFSADLSSTGVRPFNQLFVNGRRAIRARTPNGNPETMGRHTSPSGYFSDHGYLGVRPHSDSSEVTQTQVTYNGKNYPINRSPSNFRNFVTAYNGDCYDYSPPQSFWCRHVGDARVVPTGVTFWSNDLKKKWANPQTGILHTWHSGLWEGWQFEIQSRDDGRSQLIFGKGGFQGARGSKWGREYYVENIFEELDAPNEWFYNTATKTLYFYPNYTNWQSDTYEVSQISSIFRVIGSSSKPVTNVALIGLTLAHTATTFMEPYEVPSGGDWTIHRNGTVFLEGTEDARIEDCLFTSVGSTAVFVSNYNRRAAVRYSEFAWLGENAVGAFGYADKADATAGLFPLDTEMSHCLVREIGAFGKQTSAFTQSLAARSTIKYNVFFNGPRAGINFNDGFGGGNLIEWNALFNMVRETTDHGLFNSWDRQPYLTRVSTPDGSPTVYPATNRIRHNLFVGNYGSVWPIDHDDGSMNYEDSENVILFGGWKNFLGHSKKAFSNLFLYPDRGRYYFQDHTARVEMERKYASVADDTKDGHLALQSRSRARLQGVDWGRTCMQYWSSFSDTNQVDAWYNNTCLLNSNVVYSLEGCNSGRMNSYVPKVYQNRFFFPGGNGAGSAKVQCSNTGSQMNIGDLQSQGFDSGTSVSGAMNEADMLALAQRFLQLRPDTPPGPQDPVTCGQTYSEGDSVSLFCSSGQKISSVDFASYGTPTGDCSSGFKQSSCHSSKSASVVQSQCVDQSSCSVTASNDVFGDPCSGTNKYLAVKVSCTSTVGTCAVTAAEGQNASLACPSGRNIRAVDFASYGTPTGDCSAGFKKGACDANNSVSVVEKLCVGLPSCTVPGSNDIFGDPCPSTNKIIAVKVSCGSAPPPPVQNSSCAMTANEGDIASLSCPNSLVITTVEFASYGTPTGDCSAGFTKSSCDASTSVSVVEKRCVGQASCTVPGNNDLFGDPCPNTGKHVAVKVICGTAPPQSVLCANTTMEGETATLSCPSGQLISSIDFASYGTPTGDCSSGFKKGSCDASTSVSVVEKRCVGQASCTVPGNNDLFGDPCANVNKHVALKATCVASK